MSHESESRHLVPGYIYHSVSVDVVIFTVQDGALKTLLVTRSKAPFKGSPALPGGVLHNKEETLKAALRVLRDKAGLEDIDVYIEQLYTFDDAGKDPRGAMLSVSYFALVPCDKIHIIPSRSTEDPKFVPYKEISELAFGHKKILDYGLERLRSKVEYSNVAFSLLPKLFTFAELQAVYETILGRKLDKRNFRKKMVKLGLLKKTSKTVMRGRQRPAALYRFATEEPKIFKNPF